MTPRFLYPSSYPQELTSEQQEYLLSTINEWSITHGLVMRVPFASTTSNPNASYAGTIPITLFPSQFPTECFHKALRVQTTYNELYAAISSDENWLGQAVEELARIDPFIAKLWKVHEIVKEEGYVQDLTLGLFRSDYMIHFPQTQLRPTIRQVEINTNSAAFGGLAPRVTSLHRYLESINAYPASASSTIHASNLPLNPSAERIAAALAKAHTTYGPSPSCHLTCILFIVQDAERNIFDQRCLEFLLSSQFNVNVFRLPFRRVLHHTRLDAERRLLFSPPASPERIYEVTTLYFRAGQSPDEYDDVAWESRMHLERSRAIKCPSILLHLAGFKKIQQILATPHAPHLAHFLATECKHERLRSTFAPMYPMDTSPDGLEGRKLATDPETAKRFVLKPQREGGGNNIYRGAIPDFLRSIPESLWPGYVLMEMIEPPAQQNIILRDGELQCGGVICELGIYGTALWKRTSQGIEMLENNDAGYLLRTKSNQSEEGGIVAGFGSVDSVCLVDV
ncbi:glutathione synthetase-like protein [Xylaria venustula]|nr:glutathione synthetase-like protein [Xylaria venustula]